MQYLTQTVKELYQKFEKPCSDNILKTLYTNGILKAELKMNW